MFSQLQITVLEADQHSARLRIGMGDVAAPSNYRLAGDLRGPRCETAKTLQAQFQLIDQGREPQWHATALVLEPCYWSEELPMLYDLTLKVVDQEGSGPTEVDRISLAIALRPYATLSPGQPPVNR